MNDFIPNIDNLSKLDQNQIAKQLGRMPKKFWQCQNSSCAKVVSNPLRWVEGSRTTFACPYCRGNTVEIKDK